MIAHAVKYTVPTATYSGVVQLWGSDAVCQEAVLPHPKDGAALHNSNQTHTCVMEILLHSKHLPKSCFEPGQSQADSPLFTGYAT